MAAHFFRSERWIYEHCHISVLVTKTLCVKQELCLSGATAEIRPILEDGQITICDTMHVRPVATA